MPKKDRQTVMRTMEKYGNNRWWRSDDPIEVAYHQLKEPILIVSMGYFRDSLDKLFGRPVRETELVLNPTLLEEAEEAYKLHKKGLMKFIARSKVGKQIADKKALEAINQLEEYAQKNGKRIFYIDENGEVTDSEPKIK